MIDYQNSVSFTGGLSHKFPTPTKHNMDEAHSTTGRRSRQQRIPRRKFTHQTAKDRTSKDQPADRECSERGSCSSLSSFSSEDKRLPLKSRARGPLRSQRHQARRTKSDTLLPHLPKKQGERVRVRRHHSDTGLRKANHHSKDAKISSSRVNVGPEGSLNKSDVAPKLPLRRHQSDVDTSSTVQAHVKSTQMRFGDGEVGSVEAISSIDAFVDEIERPVPKEINSLHSPSGPREEDQKQRAKWTRFESPFSVQQPLVVSMVLARFRTEKNTGAADVYGQLQSPA